jgi:hypothetical protein
MREQRAEHGGHYASIATLHSSFPLLLLCVFVLVYSCLFTWIMHMSAQGQRPEVYFLGFVISLMLGTLAAPPMPSRSNMLIFCMQLCCLVHTWVSSSVVVSLLLT